MYGPHNTLHVDDLARNFALNPANGMKIKAYREDMCAPPLICNPPPLHLQVTGVQVRQRLRAAAPHALLVVEQVFVDVGASVAVSIIVTSFLLQAGCRCAAAGPGGQ